MHGIQANTKPWLQILTPFIHSTLRSLPSHRGPTLKQPLLSQASLHTCNVSALLRMASLAAKNVLRARMAAPARASVRSRKAVVVQVRCL
jgi:hypothetical protein